MRAIYLVRHGEPAFPEEGRFCLGQTDLPLSEKGKNRAKELKAYFSDLTDIHVFTSPMARCIQAAELAGFRGRFRKEAGLREISMGEWNGLPFAQIRQKWPQLYEQRGKDLLHTAPPQGESFADGAVRASEVIERVRKEYPTGDLIFFTHSGIIRMLAAHLTGEEPADYVKRDFPYGSVGLFLETENGVHSGLVLQVNDDHCCFPDTQTCESLWEEAKTPEKARLHCVAVTKKALEICDELKDRGIHVNRKAVYAGAMLHDIRKGEKRHADAGAFFLLERGYASLAALVGDHMVLPKAEERLSEKSVVFMADKYVKETREVTLEERHFADAVPEKLHYSKEHYAQAVRVRDILMTGNGPVIAT